MRVSTNDNIPNPHFNSRADRGIDPRTYEACSTLRVSTDRQQQEQTIASQLLELKKQIAEAGNVLVKEYI
jgi:hypothetical protein